MTTPYYLKLFITSSSFSTHLGEKLTGSAQPQIPADILKTFSISIPAISEQSEIARRAEALFAYADRLDARYAAARAQLEKLTPALLAKPFRGEPASALLARIKAGKEAVAVNARKTTRTRS